MLLFCPHCSSILRIQQTSASDPTPTTQNSWTCPNCTYTCPIRASRPFFEATKHARKEVEDVIGGSKQWESAQKTEVRCPNEGCDGAEAMFYQRQIRSADEPMTTFYKCVVCLWDWREG